MKPQYFHECRDEDPFVGDYLGQPAVTRWKVVAHQCATGMGPFQWFHQYYRYNEGELCDLHTKIFLTVDAQPVMTVLESLKVS